MSTKNVQPNSDNTHSQSNHREQNDAQNKQSFRNSYLTSLKDNVLLSLMAERPGNEVIWGEFYRRFTKLIAATILRECIRLNYDVGRKYVNDLLQEVYVKLLKNNGKAFKRFKGRHENSIIVYLRVISINVVRNEFAKRNQKKRQNESKIISLDERLRWQISDGRTADLHEIVGDMNWDVKMRKDELIDEIEYCLEKIFRKNCQRKRNMLIFRYYFYAGFQVKDIANFPNISISEKSIGNIISIIKKELRRELKRRWQ
jgi:RNA polymerase sigma factor (sigma-70 family)